MTDKLRELEAKATPAPWTSGRVPTRPGKVAATHTEADALFIARWRNAAPLLLDVVDALRWIERCADPGVASNAPTDSRGERLNGIYARAKLALAALDAAT